MLQFEGKKGVEFCDGLTRRDFLCNRSERASARRGRLRNNDWLANIGLRSDCKIERNFSEERNTQFFRGAAAAALAENVIL